MPRFGHYLVLLVVIKMGYGLAWSIPAAGQPGTLIPIRIDEPFAERSAAWPVTTGVPFPRGALANPAHCRLVDDTGQEQPLQLLTTATWDREGTSIRWLTIDFIAQPGRRYALEFGPDIRQQEPDDVVKVIDGEPLVVLAGSMIAEFDRTGGPSLRRIGLDRDGDGQLGDQEVMASGPAEGEHYYVDERGVRFTSGRDVDGRTIQVERVGPVRACIRVDGYYTDPNGQRGAAYRTRYHFFNGLPIVKVVDEFRITQSTQGVRWRDIGLQLQLPPASGSRIVRVDASSAEGGQPLDVSWPQGTRSIESYQSLYRHYGNLGADAGVRRVDLSGEHILSETDRIGEWMQVHDDAVAVTGSLRWLWQQFPKSWEVTPDRMILHLWSPRGGELDFSREGVLAFLGDAGRKHLIDERAATLAKSGGLLNQLKYFGGFHLFEDGLVDGQGISKHHEMLLHVGPASAKDEAAHYADLFAKQPLALPDPAWTCGTDVFGPLMPRPNEYGRYEAVVDQLMAQSRDMQHTIGDYGWWLFGSGPHYNYFWDKQKGRHYVGPYRVEFHTYQRETGLWWCYLRSGERKFYDWAIPSENHWVDIAVSHVPQQFRSDFRGGDDQPDPRMLDWPRGDWSLDGPIHFLRHHNSPEAWLRGAHQYWGTYHRTLESTSLAYFITGDERFRDVIEYWRDYWAPLAGVTSQTPGVPELYRQQAWFMSADAGAPAQTWAQMLHNYAPFLSAYRHHLTLWFNLATLYELTWDPEVGQVLQDFADVFIDREHPTGLNMPQEAQGPSNAEAPILAHFWMPAIWKYERVTRDPRIMEAIPRFFDTAYGADPIYMDVGHYSTRHIGFAYYYTRDPRYIRPATSALEWLTHYLDPIAGPDEMLQRMHPSFGPLQISTATQRLLWAIDAAKKDGHRITNTVPLKLQRAPFAVWKADGQPMKTLLWGFDDSPGLIGPDAQPFSGFEISTRKYESRLQPFDRKLTGFAAFLHELTIPAEAAGGWYLLSPDLELAVIESSSSMPVVCSATEPVAIRPDEIWRLTAPANARTLVLESVEPKLLRVRRADQTLIPASIKGNNAVFTLPVAEGEPVELLLGIEDRRGRFSANTWPTGSGTWFRIADWPAESCWIAGGTTDASIPSAAQLAAATRVDATAHDPDAVWITGRFGQGMQIRQRQTLRIPDRIEVNGKTVTLADMKQGTLEMWVKRLWDDRITDPGEVRFISNGPLTLSTMRRWSGFGRWRMPVGEWVHIALVWRPMKRDPSVIGAHLYVNGLDEAFYRSTWWEGYGNRPIAFPFEGSELEAFVSVAPSGGAFAIDELRLSNVPRYADPNVELGQRQTFNPIRFAPPDDAFTADEHTLLLMHFDGTVEGQSQVYSQSIRGKVSER